MEAVILIIVEINIIVIYFKKVTICSKVMLQIKTRILEIWVNIIIKIKN